MKKYQNRIISVGRLENQKNYKLMFDNEQGSKLIIDIVGEGSLKKDLIDIAKKNRVNVNFLGALPHETLQEYYEKYKVFISTSSYEKSRAILEAMASGCVVVAMRNEKI